MDKVLFEISAVFALYCVIGTSESESEEEEVADVDTELVETSEPVSLIVEVPDDMDEVQYLAECLNEDSPYSLSDLVMERPEVFSAVFTAEDRNNPNFAAMLVSVLSIKRVGGENSIYIESTVISEDDSE